MGNNKIYHYFVEGECEEKIINTLKVPPYSYFQAGKVEVYNFINKKITNQRITALKKNSNIILVYDIDVEHIDILKENVEKLEKVGFKVYHVQSIRNFEDEIIYSTNLKNINDMFSTQNLDEFKNRFINQKDLYKKLEKVRFDKSKIWSRINTKEPFKKYSNEESLKVIVKKK